MAAGRHRSFNTEEALEAAMLVFWRNGYPGTSLADLTEAMGINKPSLYAAFGNKEQLFMSALEQYVGRYSSLPFEKLYAAGEPFDDRLRNFLQSLSQMLGSPDLPAGCMLANSTSESAGDGIPQAANDLISELNRMAMSQLADFFTQEQARGTISSQSSPDTLALYLMSINSGMAVLARNGATPAELSQMIEHVVASFVSEERVAELD
jgi:AcrR family transcriptional regulator